MSDELDPDRFFALDAPGSQEWWYFDAISRDGRDALVIVWYVGLPFDPKYGLAAIQALQGRASADSARPMDHCAVGLSWYRDGKTVAYALNAYPRERVRIGSDPFSVEIGPTRLERDERGYRLRLETPNVDGRSIIEADLRFDPVPGTRPFECDLGGSDSPHRWMLAAPDCAASGSVALGETRRVEFDGRGYHDHNAGTEELSLAWRRWRWGRVHFGPFTQIYYLAEPRHGAPTSLSLLCRDGVEIARDRDGGFRHESWTYSGLGLKDAKRLRHQGRPGGPFGFACVHGHKVDAGPFYLRRLSSFDVAGHGRALGFTEFLDGDRLHRPWFNWMIPYRLKHPDLGPKPK